MEPLRITATLDNEVAFNHSIHFCSLLQARVAMRERSLAPVSREECRDIGIPVQLSECGRYHRCTVGYASVAAHDAEHIHRYFPIQHAVRRTNMSRVDLGAGTSKIYRIPIEKKLLVGGRMQWWCVGDRTGIADILSTTLHIGKGRARGAGKVAFWGGRWKVEPCEPWPGFPCVSVDGEAMRNLPLDTEGLTVFDVAYARVTGPFWAAWDRDDVAVPVMR